jgi:putative transposase
MARKQYPTDLTDAQWKRIEPLIPPAKPGGRPRSTDMRAVLDAIFYITRTGCAWRMLPHEFPHWRTVYEFLSAWRDDDTWATMNARLRERVRRQAGRKSEPRIGLLDSQSTKMSDQAGDRGYDAGKKDQRPQAALAR